MSRLVNDVQTLDGTFSPGVLSQTIGGLFGLVGISVAMLVLEWRLALATFVVVPLTIGTAQDLLPSGPSLFPPHAADHRRCQREPAGGPRRGPGDSGLQPRRGDHRALPRTERCQPGRQHQRRRHHQRVHARCSTCWACWPWPSSPPLAATSLSSEPPAVSVGVVVAFLAYVQQFFRPLQLLSTFYAQLQSTLAAAERIFDLVDQQPKVVDRPGRRRAWSPLWRGARGPPGGAQAPEDGSSSPTSRSRTSRRSRCCMA